MAKLGDLVVNIGANTKDLNRKLGQVQRNMRSTTGNMTKLGGSMSKSLTLPLTLIAGASTKLAVDFEASMSKVKAVSGATGAEFKSLQDKAKDLGSTTVFTASAVSDMMLEYAKVGFTTTQINAAAEATLYLAQATGSDLAQAANVAAATLGGFGLKASDTARVADVMAKSFNTSALDIQLFADSMKYVAPTAKKAGLSLETTTAMLGALAKSGIKGSAAGTALRKILGEMDKGAGTLTEKFAALNEKNLDLAGAQGEVGRSAMSALLVLMDSTDLLKEYEDGLLDSAGAAKKAADIMNDNTAGALKAMSSALEGAALVIGDKLAPMLRSLADWVSGLATKFKELEPTTQTIIIAVAALVASLGPLLLILPQILAALPLIAGAFAAMTGPIGLAVAAIASVGFILHKLIADKKEVLSLDSKATVQAQKQSAKVRFLVEQYGKEGTKLEERKKILNDLATIDADHYSDLNNTKTTLVQLTEATNNYVTSLRDQARETAILANQDTRIAEIADIEAQIIEAKEAIFNIREEFNEPMLGDFDWGIENIGFFDASLLNAQTSIQAYNEKIRRLGKDNKGLITDLEDFRDRYDDIFSKIDDTDPAIVLPDTGDTGDKGDIGSKAPPAVAGSIDALKEKVASLTTEFNKAVIGSEEFNVANTELAAANIELDKALGTAEEGLKDLGDGTEYPIGSLGQIKEKISELQSELQLLNPNTQAFIDKLAAIEELSVIVNGSLDEIDGSVKATSSAFKNLGVSISDAFVDAVFEAKNFGDAMLQIGKQLIKTLLGEAVASAIASAASSKNLANQASGGLTIPGFILAAVGSVKSAFNKVPALAGGGLAFGETMSVVGDNRNAAIDPEVIAPLSKLKEYMNGGATNVYGRISGDDIVISNSRGARDRNRFV